MSFFTRRLRCRPAAGCVPRVTVRRRSRTVEEVLSLDPDRRRRRTRDYEAWAPRVAAAWVAETRPSLTGETIGRYCVLERLGVGAMGEVYRAEDTALRRHVALKTLLPFAGDTARMRRLKTKPGRISPEPPDS